MKRIVLTGGGTAGHVTPNMALVPSLKEAGYDIQYIGSYNGIEKKIKSRKWEFLIMESLPVSSAVTLTLRTFLIHLKL